MKMKQVLHYLKVTKPVTEIKNYDVARPVFSFIFNKEKYLVVKDNENRYFIPVEGETLYLNSNNPVVDLLNFGIEVRRPDYKHNTGTEEQADNNKAASKTSSDSHGGSAKTDDDVAGKKQNQQKDAKKERNKNKNKNKTKDGYKNRAGSSKNKNSAAAAEGDSNKKNDMGTEVREVTAGSVTKKGRSLSLFVPGDFKDYTPSQRERKFLERTAGLLLRLIGNSDMAKEEASLDVVEVKKRMLAGLPLPPAFNIEVEKENKIRLLVTPDASGSCHADVAFSAKVAQALAKYPNLDVKFRFNANGYFKRADIGLTKEEEYYTGVNKFLGRFDYILYLGDYDALEVLEPLASKKRDMKIMYLSNYNKNWSKPFYQRKLSQQNLVVVEASNINEFEGIYAALKIAIKHL